MKFNRANKSRWRQAILFISFLVVISFLFQFTFASMMMLASGSDGPLELDKIRDPNLKDVILKTVERKDKVTDFANIKRLTASGRSIESLKGISILSDLEYIDLRGNPVTDFSPLSKLDNLNKIVLFTAQRNSVDVKGIISIEESDTIVKVLPQEDPVEIPDSNLKYAIRYKLNKPTGSIYPSEMATIKELWIEFKGIVDLTGLEYCVNLKALGLPNNKIADLGPISGLTEISRLELYGNDISDLNPISGLGNLESLSLEDNDITNLSHLSALGKLRSLDLGGNDISNLNPISGLGNLEDLSLWENNITDLGPLEDLQQLEHLDLGENEIVDISSIANLSHLGDLDIYGNSIESISALSDLHDLNWLQANGNKIVDVSPLSGLTDLGGVSLEGNQIDDISPLIANPGLDQHDHVNISWNLLDTSEGSSDMADIQDLQSRGVHVEYEPQNKIVDIPDPNLEEAIRFNINNPEGNIYASDLDQIGGLDLGEKNISNLTGLEYCKHLEFLDIGGNSITDLSPLSDLQHLRHLYAWGNKISEIDPLQNLTSLTRFHAQGNYISDISPLQNLTNLRELRLNRNNVINLSSITNMENLYNLELSGNEITNIQPLVDNVGIGGWDYVDVTDNCLYIAEGSKDLADIETLRERGVNIDAGDNIPPIADFNASDGEDSQSTLTWTMPNNPDIVDVALRRKTGSFPENHTDGVEVSCSSIDPTPGVENSCVDSGLENGTDYYYTVFTQGENGDWNELVDEKRNANVGSPGQYSGIDVTVLNDQGNTMDPGQVGYVNVMAYSVSGTNGTSASSRRIHFNGEKGTMNPDKYMATTSSEDLDYVASTELSGSGKATLKVEEGTYVVVVRSWDGSFLLFKEEVTAPGQVQLDIRDAVEVSFHVEGRHGMPLKGAELSCNYRGIYAGLGETNRGGDLVAKVSPGGDKTYDFLATALNYFLMKQAINVPLEGTAVDFISGEMDLGAVNVSVNDFPSTSVMWFSSKDIGVGNDIKAVLSEPIFVSAGLYDIFVHLEKDGEEGVRWYYWDWFGTENLEKNEEINLQAGGDFTPHVETAGKPFNPGKAVKFDTYVNDAYGNNLKGIGKYYKGGVSERVLPRLNVLDPNWDVILHEQSTALWGEDLFEYQLGESAPLGTYRAKFIVDTGPHQSEIRDTLEFEVVSPSPVQLATFHAGTWWVDINCNDKWDGEPDDLKIENFGSAGNQAAIGDLDGDGKDEIAVFQAGTWWIDKNNNLIWDGEPDDKKVQGYGSAGNKVAAADFDGNGTVEIATFNAGTWWIDLNNDDEWSGDPPDKEVDGFGNSNNQVAAADFDGDDIGEIATFTAGTWWIDLNNNGKWDGEPPDRKVEGYGSAGNIVAAGNLSYATGAASSLVWGNVSGLSLSSALAYPNPVSKYDTVTFQVNGKGVSAVKVDLFSASGQKVYSSEFVPGRSVAVDFGDQGFSPPNGLYLYQISALGKDSQVKGSEFKKLLVID